MLVLGLFSLIAASLLVACGDDPEIPLEVAPTLPPATPTAASSQPTVAEEEPTPEPTAQVNDAQEYEVQPGDTLSVIAEEFGVTVDAIAQLNDIADPNLIQPGQTLLIPGP